MSNAHEKAAPKGNASAPSTGDQRAVALVPAAPRAPQRTEKAADQFQGQGGHYVLKKGIRQPV